MLLKEENVSCNYPLSEGGITTEGCYEAEVVKPLQGAAFTHCSVAVTYTTACKSSCREMTACCILPWR